MTAHLDLIRHPDGISAIDTLYVRPRLDAAHLIVHEGRAAFVDTGTCDSVPQLLAALDVLGVARECVDYVFLTHVHLDHAGGAGQLMQALPNARAVLHPRGAPHMLDPTRLVGGTIAVYGEAAFRRLYGEVVPIAADRIIVTEDRQRVELAGRPFEFVHTPGHALHHHCIVDLDAEAIFTGDTFGISYREFDVGGRPFIFTTATPTQFDPRQLDDSIDRLLAYRPRAMYLTHYSRVTDVERLAADLREDIYGLTRIATQHADEPHAARRIRSDMLSMWRARLRKHGCDLSDEVIERLLAGDLDLNAQGLVAWLERRH